MKNFSLLVFLLSLGLFTVSCATDPAGGGGAAVKPYPLDKCLVMDVPLAKMGKPKRIVYQGQEMKFCCKRCVKAFKADPEPYLAKLK
ncbi:MAG: YHS domain-containing protein [Verrucomicrobiales bacterium]|nr:YHS domain-containing protein [Verrucomicrobiales bacterium]